MTDSPLALTVTDQRGLSDWRCSHCQSLLARQELSAGHVEIKCRKCGTVNSLRVKEGRASG